MTAETKESIRHRVLVIVSGGIAAYRVPDLLSRLRDCGITTRCIMTQAAEQFITPLTLATMSNDRVYTDLFSQNDEASIDHIRLSRDADMVLVVPCTAHMMAKMANGLADDMASTVLLATDKPIFIAPAMNVKMWEHPATQANLDRLVSRGVQVIEPTYGPMACGEVGMGRLADINDIATIVEDALEGVPEDTPPEEGPLRGCKALVTSGPTIEDIDPVRFLSNRSSGRQGHTIAEALAALGADVTLVSGPVSQPDPVRVTTCHVRSAQDMFEACQKVAQNTHLDVAVCVAAVADWTVSRETHKIKKDTRPSLPSLRLQPTPDILSALSKTGPHRPRLVIGFAAETRDVVSQARAKRQKKGCDWICANDVALGTSTIGGPHNSLHIIADDWEDVWPLADKGTIARRLARAIATTLSPASAPATTPSSPLEKVV